MSIYLCRNGHKHRSQSAATNCGYCRRQETRSRERQELEARGEENKELKIFRFMFVNPPSKEFNSGIIFDVNQKAARKKIIKRTWELTGKAEADQPVLLTERIRMSKGQIVRFIQY